jgi:2-polyprenyl-6-methoxyphenol hydroxylase-like FAD-dependent oxidoreductase
MGCRIIIAGGGVAGLTLANALERAGVDFVLLERRPDLAPQAGAAIGILPNGSRILDQLGIWNKLYRQVQPAFWWSDRDNNGHLLKPRTDMTSLVASR